MATKEKHLISFRGFRRMTVEDAERLRAVKVSPNRKCNEDLSNTPDVIKEMFAPDPETGNPSSEFYIRMQGDDDVARYIDDYFMRQLPQSPVTDDSELALESAKSRFESKLEYADRLRGFLNKDVK